MRNRSRIVVVALVGWTALSAGRLVAQFDEYKTPGGPEGRPDSRKAALDRAVSSARWRLGALHLDPWIGIKNVEYVDNAFGTAGQATGDLTATAGAGLRAYLRAGRKVVVAAHVLPEYVWWRDLTDRRRLDGRYGLGVFAYGNRATLEVTATRDQEQRIASPEVLQQIHTRNDRGELALEVPLGGAFSVFGDASRLAVRNLAPSSGADPREAELAGLDRDETLLSGGLRWSLPRRWTLGAGVERSDVQFVDRGGPLDRSSTGTSPLVELRRDDPDLYVNLRVARRSLAPKGGSSFTPYHGATVDGSVGLRTDRRLSIWLYGSRDLVYSVTAGYSYIRDDRAGAALQWRLGWRTGLRVFGEAGRNGYTAAAAGIADRRDDVQSYGATLTFGLRGSANLVVHAARDQFRSNLPGLDRGLTSVGVGLTLGGRGTWY